MKKLHPMIPFFGLLVMLMTGLVACGNAASMPEATISSPTVHLKDTNFAQQTITVQKGQSLTIINDSPSLHVLSNGSWDGSGKSMAKMETGAPKVDIVVDGNTQQTVGPFMTAGTFHIYCMTHMGMNLTVIAK